MYISSMNFAKTNNYNNNHINKNSSIPSFKASRKLNEEILDKTNKIILSDKFTNSMANELLENLNKMSAKIKYDSIEKEFKNSVEDYSDGHWITENKNNIKTTTYDEIYY